MSESRVNRTLKRLARMAQLTPAQIRQIMVRGGCSKTDTVMRYIERVKPGLMACVDPRQLTQTSDHHRLPG